MDGRVKNASFSETPRVQMRALQHHSPSPYSSLWLVNFGPWGNLAVIALASTTMLVGSQALTAITNGNIHSAVDAWCTNSASAQSTYGHISIWDTSSVTNMNSLFREDPSSEPCYNFDFNEVRGQEGREFSAGVSGRRTRGMMGGLEN